MSRDDAAEVEVVIQLRWKTFIQPEDYYDEETGVAPGTLSEASALECAWLREGNDEGDNSYLIEAVTNGIDLEVQEISVKPTGRTRKDAL